jgi:hypothetical protein
MRRALDHLGERFHVAGQLGDGDLQPVHALLRRHMLHLRLQGGHLHPQAVEIVLERLDLAGRGLALRHDPGIEANADHQGEVGQLEGEVEVHGYLGQSQSSARRHHEGWADGSFRVGNGGPSGAASSTNSEAAATPGAPISAMFVGWP